jgi:hypothetical protein
MPWSECDAGMRSCCRQSTHRRRQTTPNEADIPPRRFRHGAEDRRMVRSGCLLLRAPGEPLEPAGDDLDGPAGGAVGRLPGRDLQPALNVNEAALPQVRGGELG